MKSKPRTQKASKVGGVQGLSRQLPPTVAAANSDNLDKPKSKRGVKTAGEALDRLIAMANLAGDLDLPYDHFKNSAFESTTGLLAAIMQLDDPLRAHLLQVMTEPEQEPWTTADMVKAGFNPDYARLRCQSQAVSTRYQLIRGAWNTLSRVAAGADYFPAETFIERRVDESGKHTAYYVTSEITQPLIGVDLRDIRRCAVCEIFFFARRATSAVCDPESPCAVTYSKRKERENKKQREKVAELKTKRAQTARKR